MKIFHYHEAIRLESGGVVRAVLDMCELLASRGADVTLVTPDDSDVPQDWKDGKPGCPKVQTVPRPARPGRLFSSRQLHAMEAVFKDASAIHLHAVWTPANAQLGRLADRLHKPYILTVHGMLDDWSMAQKTLKKQIYLGLTGRRMLNNARFIHCTAGFELEQAKKWFTSGRGIVVPLAFDLDEYQTLPGPALAKKAFRIEDGTPVVLFLSRVHYKKGLEVLIDAARILRDRGLLVRTLIAGTGDESYLQDMQTMTTSLGLDGDVEFLGMVTGDTKLSLFERADLFVLPTSQENWGFVFFESLACRTPVITTRLIDTWPELEQSGGALLVDRTAEAFAAAMQEMLDDPAQRAEMGEAGRKWVFSQLNADTVAERFFGMYHDAVRHWKKHIQRPIGASRIR